MFFKSLLQHIYLIIHNTSLYFVLLFLVISYKFLSSNLTAKFGYFVLSIFISSIWGFMFGLDGVMLILITTELTALLMLVMTYTQLLPNLTPVKRYIFIIPTLFIASSLLTSNSYSVTFILTNYYAGLTDIVASDFYILYQAIFTELTTITFILIIVISLFSLFFILIYFNLKLKKLEGEKKGTQILYLRKQFLQKQTIFSNKLQTFQN